MKLEPKVTQQRYPKKCKTKFMTQEIKKESSGGAFRARAHTTFRTFLNLTVLYIKVRAYENCFEYFSIHAFRTFYIFSIVRQDFLLFMDLIFKFAHFACTALSRSENKRFPKFHEFHNFSCFLNFHNFSCFLNFHNFLCTLPFKSSKPDFLNVRPVETSGKHALFRTFFNFRAFRTFRIFLTFRRFQL